MQKVGGEAALLWASLLPPFIPFSTGGKKDSTALKERSSRCSYTSPLQQKKKKDKRSLHVSIPITLISFQPEIFPTLVHSFLLPPFFCFFFPSLPSQWCASCQGQREVLAKRSLGIKANTDSHRRQCLRVLMVRLYLPEMMEEKNHTW